MARTMYGALSSWVVVVALAKAAIAAQVPSVRSFSVEPPADWVAPLEIDVGVVAPESQLSGGLYYLLSDRQVRVARERATFSRSVRRIVNDAGLENASQIMIAFDPTFQRLKWHWVRVRRSGVWSDRLEPAKVQLLQRESRLESQIYDGRVTAVLFVEDLRVGDEIDYAYTLAGANPVLGGRYVDAFSVEWSVPLHRQRFRLLWPSERRLFVRPHRTTLAPTVRETGAYTECVWELHDPKPVFDEAGAPAWFDSYGWIQLSEFATWAEVAEWGSALFESSAPLPPEILARVDEWRRLPPEEAALAALRFVQDEVRYLGIELGASSHQPAPPEVVFKRRFGDCKDKARLMCALFRALGFRAWPALVHSSSGRSLDEWQPSPYAFDHVVVRLDLPDQTVWLDATLTGQGGSVRTNWFPDYARALVLEPEADELTTIAARTLDRPSTVVEEAFQVPSFEAPVGYTVVTRYEGGDADRVRRDFRERSLDAVGAGYLKFYTQQWPSVRAEGAVQFTDDRAANVFTTTERYSIPSFWSTPKNDGRHEVALWASTVDGVLGQPERDARWSPYHVGFPVLVRQSTRVSLPEEWELEDEAKDLSDPSLRFAFRARRSGREITLDYQYQSLTGAVSPGGFPAHVKTLGEVRDRLSFRLRRPVAPPGSAARWNWRVPFVFGGVLVLALVAAGFIQSHASDVAPPRVPHEAPVGRGGWLAVFGVFTALWLVIDVAWLLLGHDDWSLRAWLEHTAAASDDYQPFWGAVVLLSVASAAVHLAGGILVLTLLLRRRRSLPATYAGYVALRALLFLAFVLMAATIPDRRLDAIDVFCLGLLLFGPAAAWAGYLFASDRARATLVR